MRTRRLPTATGIPSAAAAARARELRREAAADPRVLAVHAAARRIQRVRTAHGTRSAAAAVPEAARPAHRVSEAAPHRMDLARPRGRSPADRLRAASAVRVRRALVRLRGDSAQRDRSSADAAARALRSGRASMEAVHSESRRSRAAAVDSIGAGFGWNHGFGGWLAGGFGGAARKDAGDAVSDGDSALAGV